MESEAWYRMQLNWRKIIFIIVCAEFLFIYWNSLSTMNFKKQQTTHMAPTVQPHVPITQVQSPLQQQKNENEINRVDQKSS